MEGIKTPFSKIKFSRNIREVLDLKTEQLTINGKKIQTFLSNNYAKKAC
jgi:hypothetical protein